MPKAFTNALVFVGLALAPGLAGAEIAPRAPAPAEVSVCFRPADQDCAGQIIAAIVAAHAQIRVQAYGFTARPILQALADARARGVDVAVILDKSDTREKRGQPSSAAAMAEAGVPVWIDQQLSIAHNKVVIIDGRLVIGGSYNYTASAEKRNGENVTFTVSPVVARWYLENWESRRAASRQF